MKKIVTLILGFALVISSQFAKADEGMWIPALLTNNYAEMQRLGLTMTPEQVYSINNSSMKIKHTNWGANSPKGDWQFATPYINIIRNEEYTQVSFVVGSHHWWVIINNKNKQQ